MASVKDVAGDLQARILELEHENEMMERGVVATRERLVRNGRALLIDNTRRSLQRNKQWIADLKFLLAAKSGSFAVEAPRELPPKGKPSPARIFDARSI